MALNKPCCIDIYDGDNVIGDQDQGFVQTKGAGIFGLDQKATEGQTIKSSLGLLALRYKAWMDDQPIPVTEVDGTILQLKPRFGFYHFFDGGNPAAEAANFLSVVKQLFNKGDDLCLDWEDVGASGYQPPAVSADDFCKAVEDWCQFPIKVYGGDCPREQLANASPSIVTSFAKRRFWFCQYGSYQAQLIPVPWQASGPYMWQDDGDKYGPGPHTIPGIGNLCDNSTVVGKMTVAKLYAGWGGGSA